MKKLCVLFVLVFFALCQPGHAQLIELTNEEMAEFRAGQILPDLLGLLNIPSVITEEFGMSEDDFFTRGFSVKLEIVDMHIHVDKIEVETIFGPLVFGDVNITMSGTITVTYGPPVV